MQKPKRAAMAAVIIAAGLSTAACQGMQVATTTVNPAILEGGRAALYDQMIQVAAKKHGVPAELAHAIVKVESNYNPKAKGSHGEIGLMQIKPATARDLGYEGTAAGLHDPKTNLEWGMKYLAGAHEKAGGDLCGTVLRYNAGHNAKRMNPVSRKYCDKVKDILAVS